MERRLILTGELEAKMRAEIAEIQKRFRHDEDNYDYLLGYLKYKRPSLILPKISGASCPLQKRRQNLQQRIGPYQLMTFDSDDEGTTREHDYCNPGHFTGFTHSEVIESVQRYFLVRDAKFIVATELSVPQDEPKKPLHIKLELTESELIRAYDHETHYGYLLDPDFRVDKTSPASVEELGSEEFDEELLNALLPRNDRPDEMIPNDDFPDVLLPNSDIHDSLLPDSYIPNYTLPVKGVHDNLLHKVNGRKEGVETTLGGGRCLNLLPSEDNSVHDDIVLDSNQAELFQLNESNISNESVFVDDGNDNGLGQHNSSSLQNVESNGNFHCVRDNFSRLSPPQNISVNDDVGDDLQAAECEMPEIEEEEESDLSGCIVVAGDPEGEFIGDDINSRDPDNESRISDLSLPNSYPDSASETSFFRPSSIKGWESDVTSTTCTSGISLLDIDSDVDPNLGKIYGHYPGIEVNSVWTYRVNLARSGCHRPLRKFIHIGPEGAYSLLLQNALVVRDFGDSVVVYGEPAYKSTAKKSKTRRRSSFNKRRKKSQKKCDQTMTGGNLALYYSMVFEKPIRVVRSHTMKSEFSPSTGYRYEGLFYVYSIHIVKTYEKIREFRFVLISDPSLFASREAPRLWQLEGKLPPPTPMLMNFGHPRDTVIGRGCRESVQETSPLQPVETVSARLVKDTKKQASKRLATDSKREEHVRKTRSVSCESGVETRSGRRSRLLAAESVGSNKSERMVETSMLGAKENTVVKLVSKRQGSKSVKTTIKGEIHHAKPATVVPAESVKIYPRKRARPATVTQLHTEDKLMDPRKEEKRVTSVKLRRLECGDSAVPGPSGLNPSLKTGEKVTTRSHNRSYRKSALWLEKVEKWNTELY
ncbi:uncharacterized protein [Anabrus simplex]|uniref:uncharacterized protein n=1 Tax=Anabrus simplex TaxID=316456 RepID=UPI0035A381F9